MVRFKFFNPVLVPHMKASIKSNTVLIHAKVRVVCTFLLYFCISSLKDSSKFQYYFYVWGDTPTYMHTNDIKGSLLLVDAHHNSEVTDVILEMLMYHMFVQSSMKNYAGR